MKELTGTPKQIAWAEDIREKAYRAIKSKARMTKDREEYKEENEKAAEAWKTIKTLDTKELIDIREKLLSMNFVEDYEDIVNYKKYKNELGVDELEEKYSKNNRGTIVVRHTKYKTGKIKEMVLENTYIERYSFLRGKVIFSLYGDRRMRIGVPVKRKENVIELKGASNLIEIIFKLEGQKHE